MKYDNKANKIGLKLSNKENSHKQDLKVAAEAVERTRVWIRKQLQEVYYWSTTWHRCATTLEAQKKQFMTHINKENKKKTKDF